MAARPASPPIAAAGAFHTGRPGARSIGSTATSPLGSDLPGLELETPLAGEQRAALQADLAAAAG